jgi:lipopolysaccharide/colanic/teichoic acid biosynthesis glycosyltransferase
MGHIDVATPQAVSTDLLAVKRAFDLVVSTVLVIVCLPVFALTALTVYLTLGKPLFFEQERAGLATRPFRIRKFRTMTDERDGQGRLLPDALRQTAVTVFLRRIRVDELPQLLAILKGDMSFVGPRPLPLESIADFGTLGRLRCAVRPGLTGWAQVNGNTLLTPAQKLALDIWYIEHRSFLFDLRIVLMTIGTILAGEKVNVVNLKKAQMHLSHRESTDADGC